MSKRSFRSLVATRLQLDKPTVSVELLLVPDQLERFIHFCTHLNKKVLNSNDKISLNLSIETQLVN